LVGRHELSVSKVLVGEGEVHVCIDRHQLLRSGSHVIWALHEADGRRVAGSNAKMVTGFLTEFTTAEQMKCGVARSVVVMAEDRVRQQGARP
jgi:hypothetical protein